MRSPVFALLVMIAGCSGRDASGPTQGVVALAGDTVAEAGATVVSHLADGTAIDEQVADATGRAEVATEAGAYVSVVFPGVLDPIPATISIVTAPATADGSDLVIHGPRHASIPLVIGALTITAPALAGATAFTIDAGCTTIAAAALPDTVDVIAPCEGTDTNLDVLVRGYDVADPATQTLLGYGAGRVPIGMDESGNSIWELDIGAWATTGAAVPVTQDGTTATVALDLVSDTLVFPTPAITDQALVWDGLVVDASIATAAMGSQITTQYAPAAPASIALGTGDFLGAIAPGLELVDRSTLAFQWEDLADSAVGGVDAIDLHVVWTNGAQLVWDAVLSPDTVQIAFPQLDANLQQLVPLPAATSIAVTTDFAVIDSSDLADFAALETAGIYTDGDATIVPPPTTGEIRTSHAATSQ